MERVSAGCSEEGASPVVQSALPRMVSELAGRDNSPPRSGSSLCDSPEGRNNVAGSGNCK